MIEKNFNLQSSKLGFYVPFNSQGHIRTGPQNCHLPYALLHVEVYRTCIKTLLLTFTWPLGILSLSDFLYKCESTTRLMTRAF